MIAFEEYLYRSKLGERRTPTSCKVAKNTYESYFVNKMAEDASYSVLRSLSYRCEVNPIELIWAQMNCLYVYNILLIPSFVKHILILNFIFCTNRSKAL